MPPLVMMLAAVLAIAGVLVAAMAARERQSDPVLALPSAGDGAGSPAIDALARQVTSLTDALVRPESAPLAPRPTPGRGERAERGEREELEAYDGSGAAIAHAPLLVDSPAGDVWDSLGALGSIGSLPRAVALPVEQPTPSTIPEPGPEVVHVVSETVVAPEPEAPPAPSSDASYGALSRDLTDQGRTLEAIVARWAEDLHRLAPVLAGREESLVEGLLDGTINGSDDPAATYVAVRDHALALTDPALHQAGPGSEPGEGDLVPDLGPCLVPGGHPAPRLDPVVHDDVEVLRERARSGVERSLALADLDPVAARQSAWEADLAAFDVVLLASAQRAADVRLASVRLRRSLALTRLRDEREPAALAATTGASLTGDVDRVRAVLTGVVEPHEREALDASFGTWVRA